MSGLASNEIRLEQGTIGVRIGEGRTAEVLRNICYQVSQDAEKWDKLIKQIYELFEVQVNNPYYIQDAGRSDDGLPR